MKICILCDYVEKVKVGKAEDVIADQEPWLTAKAIKEVLEKKGHRAEIVKIESLKTIPSLKKKFDFVFNLAEGIKGDEKLEPEIAASLEKHKIPFTGSKKKALLLCLDKSHAKKVLMEHRIPTPRSELFKSEKAAIHLDFPMIVKPVHEDGGIGISGSSVVHDEAALRKKVKEILTVYKQPALVEEFIDGREVSVSVIGNSKEIEVLPLFELVFNFPAGVPKIRSYESKWIEDSMEFKQTHHKVPAEIDKKTAAHIRREAIRAFQLTGCHDYARIDFRLKGNKPYVLEVNPNPCLYPVDATLVFCAKAAGYTYDEIILKIFEMARKRYK